MNERAVNNINDLISGELPELECSVSSTKPHTVNLCTDQELPAPVVQIATGRNTRVVANSHTSNSAGSALPNETENANQITTDSERNDVPT